MSEQINIPDMDNLNSLNGEGVWGWVSPDAMKKYNDDSYHGELTAILCNTPLNFHGILWWGSEVKIKCNGVDRPTLSMQWAIDNIMSAEWFCDSPDETE